MLRLFLLLVLALTSVVGHADADQIRIENRIGNGRWTIANSITVARGQQIQLRIKQIENAEIRWFQIIPDTTTRYNNAEWPWMPGAYKWKGYDTIKYTRKELKDFSGKWLISITNSGSATDEKIMDRSGPLAYVARKIFSSADYSQSRFYNPDHGSFWYRAEVEKDGQILKTPGIEDNDQRGLSPNVFRVSLKDGDDLIGNLSSFFNVPAIFGSTPYQVKNYIGVDCADVLMAAYSITKGEPIKKDYNVAAVTRTFPVITKAQVANGQPDKKIYWGRDIHRGYFIAVRYNNGKQYQHIGALYKDANKNDILDAEDIILHAGPDPLHYTKLAEGAFDGEIMILKPDLIN